MQITREDEPSMILIVDTGKVNAVRAAFDLTADATANAMFDAVLDNQNVFKRSFFMLVSRIPPAWIDSAIERLMSRRPKKG